MPYDNYFTCAFCHTPLQGDFRQGQTELVLYNPAPEPCSCTLTAYFTDKPPVTLPMVNLKPETNELLIMPDVAPQVFKDCGFWGAKVSSSGPFTLNVIDGYVNQDPSRPMFHGGCTNFHGTKLDAEWRFPDGLWLEWMKLYKGDASKAPFPFNESELYFFLNPHTYPVEMDLIIQYHHKPYTTHHIILQAEHLYVWDNYEKVDFVQNYTLRALSSAPITASAVRLLYGLKGLQEWGTVVHCAMHGIPGAVLQE